MQTGDIEARGGGKPKLCGPVIGSDTDRREKKRLAVEHGGFDCAMAGEEEPRVLDSSLEALVLGLWSTEYPCLVDRTRTPYL